MVERLKRRKWVSVSTDDLDELKNFVTLLALAGLRADSEELQKWIDDKLEGAK